MNIIGGKNKKKESKEMKINMGMVIFKDKESTWEMKRRISRKTTGKQLYYLFKRIRKKSINY